GHRFRPTPPKAPRSTSRTLQPLISTVAFTELANNILPADCHFSTGLAGSLFHWHDQILHDVVFALGGVLAHVEAEDVGDFRLGGVLDPAEAHVVADKLLELRGGDFAQALETRDFAALAQLLSRRIA